MIKINAYFTLLTLLFVFDNRNCFGQTKQDSIQKIIDQTEFAEVIEVMPSFPGGVDGLKKFIATNLKVPQNVKEKKIIGKTFLKLGILKDGTAVFLKINKTMDGCPECDQAAIDLIKIMPKWSQAQMQGKIVPCYWNMPIEFSYKN